MKKKSIILGITGHLATGKSTVAAMFAAKGAGVINADLLAHRALRRQGACYKKVLALFGNEILSAKEIDRAKLAAIVFADAVKLKKLEKIVHPFVIEQTRKEVLLFEKAGKKVIVLDVPLLFESGMDKYTDSTIVVRATKKIQLLRIKAAGRLNYRQALDRMRFQWPMSKKARRADIIIDNGGTIVKTQNQVNKIWDMFQLRYLKTNNNK